MPLFRKKEKGPEKTLDELIADAKGFIEDVTPKLEPEEDLVPAMVTDRAISALVLPSPHLDKEMQKIASKSARWVFWATAWQAEGVTDQSVRASDHPDRFEVVLIDAADREADRREMWRAKLTRIPGKAPLLGDWERTE